MDNEMAFSNKTNWYALSKRRGRPSQKKFCESISSRSSRLRTAGDFSMAMSPSSSSSNSSKSQRSRSRREVEKTEDTETRFEEKAKQKHGITDDHVDTQNNTSSTPRFETISEHKQWALDFIRKLKSKRNLSKEEKLKKLELVKIRKIRKE